VSDTIPKMEPAMANHIATDGITPIGWQAYDIIYSILEDPSPELAEVKWRLRRCVAAHPGSPERALQAHLMATSEVVNAYGQERPA
jgi:hypothetical protein